MSGTSGPKEKYSLQINPNFNLSLMDELKVLGFEVMQPAIIQGRVIVQQELWQKEINKSDLGLYRKLGVVENVSSDYK